MDYTNSVTGFTKLFSTIVHSTVWREKMHIKVVWITMLAMADRNGRVLASLPGLADVARVSVAQCRDALTRFMSPDPDSRTKDADGRRIEEIDGGWRLLNYLKYREMRDKTERRLQVREAVRRHRERKAAGDVISNQHVSPGKPKQKQKQKQNTENEQQKQNEPPASRPPADSNAEETARKYLAVRDAVFGTRTRVLPDDVVRKAKARLHDWKPWQIIALPILVYAHGKTEKHSPEVYLRDGEKPRTRNGNTYGGYYWIARTFERVDGTRLDARLKSIAEQAGLLEELTEVGVITDATQC